MDTEENVFCKASGNNYHDFKIGIEFHAENDGIGPYEFWGFCGVDNGSNFPVLDEVYALYLVRIGEARSKEEIPKLKGIEYKIEKDSDSNEEVYVWAHSRALSTTSDVADEIANIVLSEIDLEDYNDYE